MRALIVSSLVALGACGPAPADPQAPTQQAAAPEAENLCPASAATVWTGEGGATFALEAAARGGDCARATATLTVRGPSGDVVLRETFPAAQVMTLAGAESVTDMERRLAEWISPPGATFDSTGDLPTWAQGAVQPINEEFPFYPEEGFGRAAYEALRARDAAMFCFVQGMESLACYAQEGGRLVKIGVQSFPG